MAEFSYHEDERPKKRRLNVTAFDKQSLAEIEKQNYDHLYLVGGDFSKMADLPLEAMTVKRLKLGRRDEEVSWVGRMHSLEWLSGLGKFPSTSSLLALTKLKHLGASYSAPVKRVLESDVCLDTLVLSSFTGEPNDFSDSIKTNLSLLHLSGTTSSLNGLEKFKSLEKISLERMKNLVDISILVECCKLRELSIAACNNVNYSETLPLLKKLQRLVFENKSLASLDLVPKDNLELLYLGSGTTIEDRDVLPLLSFPKLKTASYVKRKGYKYNALELDNLRKMQNET